MDGVDEYLCATVRSRSGESADDFRKRLTAFWSHMLRALPEDFERVYAETAKVQPAGDRLTRQYLLEAAVADVLATELISADLDHDPIDADDVYTKYEATPPDWFQIEH